MVELSLRVKLIDTSAGVFVSLSVREIAAVVG